MIKSHGRPNAIDIFCGAGGLSLGFQAAGCRIQAAVDIDETAAATYSENFAFLQPGEPPDVVSGDEGNIEDLDLDRLVTGGRPDILIGGPPCQGFSRVGRAKLDSLSEEGFAGDPRNELYRCFLQAAELWRPAAVVMENVPGMTSVRGRNVADDAAADLARRGYRVGYALLNAVWYGVPQFRERLFVMGLREDLGVSPSMPPATHSAVLPSGYLGPAAEFDQPLPFIQHLELSVAIDRARLPATTVAQALDDLPPITEHLDRTSETKRRSFRTPRAYRSAPHSTFAELMRSWPGLADPKEVHDHVIRRTPRDYETFRRMKPGDRYPEAVRIARERMREHLASLGARDETPAPGTPEYVAIERRFVPPYPEHMFLDKWRKLMPDQPCWTIPAHLSKDAYSHIHHDGEQARAISIREAARLQSFPDAFTFTGNMGDCYRQIGNAVPPLLSWAIAHTVLTSLGFDSRAPSGAPIQAALRTGRDALQGSLARSG